MRQKPKYVLGCDKIISIDTQTLHVKWVLHGKNMHIYWIIHSTFISKHSGLVVFEQKKNIMWLFENHLIELSQWNLTF